jgi:hypothetical protein
MDGLTESPALATPTCEMVYAYIISTGLMLTST